MSTTQLIPIKKGTTAARCPRRCGATVFWVERPRSGGGGTVRMPIDTDVPGGSEPDCLSAGAGINHFTVCTEDA